MNLTEYLKSINKFKDGMSFEEIAEALAETKVNIGETVEKSLFDRTASDLAAAKKQLKERMTAEEQQKDTDDQIAAEIASLRKENSIYKQTQAFISGGYDSETARKLAEHTANGEMDKFVEVSNAWAQAKQESIRNSLTEELMKGQNPSPQGGSAASSEVEFAKQSGKAIAETQKASNDALNYYFGG